MEHDEQVYFFNLLDTFRSHHPVFPYIYAVPNGGFRHIKTARLLKQEGAKPGVPDIHVPYPSQGYHGMYIEMKYGRNKPTEQQNNYMKFLSEAGYYCVVCYGGSDAFEKLVDYLGLDLELLS